MIEARRAALVMIDMQNGFIAPSSALCVPGAAATVGACADALAAARRQGMEVVHVRRAYAADGSDVEPVRHGAWLAGGRPICVEGDDPSSLDCPDVLTPADGERVLLKPRFSAFFGTSLDRVLRRAGVDAVVLTGTALPNCVRSTAYDALSLNYNVAVVSDATSSRTPEAQAANLADLAAIGAYVLDVAELAAQGLAAMPDALAGWPGSR